MPPTREVTSRIELNVLAPARLVLQVAVADGPRRHVEELEISVDGRPAADVREIATTAGGRLHVLDVGAGPVVVAYRSVVSAAVPPAPPEPDELFSYLRPSRYSESDKLFALAQREVAGATPASLALAAQGWVRTRLAYVLSSSRGTDSAVDTMLAGAGVCRDYAHLLVALLRARDVPARLVSVYAPGLDPMDFHAVVEAWLGERWCALDATGLAPRQSLVRIATGRDAADTAFVSTQGGGVELVATAVTATASPGLPVDPPDSLVTLG